ncbi:MAG: hypothetical protein AAGF12_24525 [Myxococcota bacterium]
MRNIHLILPLTFLALGCGETSGSRPTIRSLTLTPEQVTVGAATSLAAQVQFEDPDGDVLEAWVTFQMEDGTGATTTSVRVTGASGLTSGQVSVQLSVAAPAPGAYLVTIWLRDAEGNDSNRFDATVRAE